jgi:TPR repeat protein
MQWVFETLGIDKQADVSTVRKAYAKAIKQCNQATEADRFQRIRQAYEFALQWAKQREDTASAAPQTPLRNMPTTAMEPSIAVPTVVQHTDAPPPLTPPQQTAPTPIAQPPATSQPLDSRTSADPPNPPHDVRPGSTPPVAFAPTSSLPIAQPGLQQRPIERAPFRPHPIVSRPSASLPPTRLALFKPNDHILESGARPSFDNEPAGGPPRVVAKAVLHEFLIEACKPNVMSVAEVLGRYANDARLTSLDAKDEFEQSLLAHVFSGPVYVSILDAACDQFGWETFNRHLGARPDLIQRMQRHQSLRHLLAASSSADEDLQWCMRAYTDVQRNPRLRVEPWEIVKANRLLDRLGAFKQELGERYHAEAFDWWQQKLTSNPTLLASYRENKPALQTPPPLRRRSQQTTRRPGGILLLIGPLLAIVGAMVGHSPFNAPSYEPSAYTAPTRTHYQRATPSPPPMPPASSGDNPYLMDVDTLRRVAAQGDPTAQNYLGVRYENGTGVSKDTKLAAYWFQRAAVQGFPEAQLRLGELYKKGDGLPQSSRLAVAWWRKAAINGNALAQNNLAKAYANGDGVKKDYQEAQQWWQKAAFNDIPNAKASLGWLYENGYGVPRDVKAAVDWYRKAAARGDITGQVDLAWMYERGEGVPLDPVIADALVTVAGEHQITYDAQRGPKWTEIDRISAKFTPAQESAASQIARDLLSSPGKFLDILDAASRFRHPT